MDVIELAKEAGFEVWEADYALQGQLERFAALVRAGAFTEAKEHFGKHLVGFRASVREQSLDEAAQRAEAYAYMSDNFNVLAAEIRSMK